MASVINHTYKQLEQRQGFLYSWFSAMHTRVDILLVCDKTEAELLEIINDISTELERLERIGNYYNPESELYEVNRIAATQEVTISKELCEMIDICLQYHEKTDGCFDITIKSPLYHEHTIKSVSLSTDKQTIFYKEQNTQIDLSGFLKGYALDRIKHILNNHHIKDALVNMGNSSVLAIGNHPHGKGWKVSFSDYTSEDDDLSICLKDECLTTSGNNTEARKHIISPKTGKYVEGKKQIALITEDGTVGEILSTSLFAAATPLQQKQLINNFHIKAIYEM